MSINPALFKYGSFYLVESNDNNMLALRELSKEEYDKITGLSEQIHKYHYHKRRYRELELNLEDFFAKYSHYEACAITGKYEDKQDFFELVYVDLNRVLTNFLSSFRLFADNLQIFIRKKYGRESSQAIEFDRILKNEFDSKFEYRLIYALRNYSQHNYFPINLINLETERDQYFRVFKNSFQASFDKTKFLEEPKTFKHLLVDFNLYGRSFPVLPQMNRIRKCLSTLNEAFLKTEKDDLVICINKLLYYFQFKEMDGALGFAKFSRTNRSTGVFDSIEIPVPILRQAYRDIEEKEPEF